MEVSDPGWFSLLPPLVAIVIALTLRSVIPALFLGIWLGAWGLAGLDLAGLWQGLLDAVAVFVKQALGDESHAAIIIFSCMIGGLIGIIRKNGGMQGIVSVILHHAVTRRRGQLATAGMGLALFIDDYANSLVVGQTMRPVTDRMGVSREKLAYLVDSTAAPVAALGLVTTWIGYQVGLLDDAVSKLPEMSIDPYLLFLQSLGYSFYPWFCVFLVFVVAWTGRDIGPMRAAESRAASGDVPPERRDDSTPLDGGDGRILNAVIPLAVLIFGVVAGLYATGEGENLQEIIGSANAYLALMWASLVAVLVALFLPLAQRRNHLEELMTAWQEGVASMVGTMIILILAWALADVADKLGTAEFLVALLGDSLPAWLLPALVFLIAAATSFATGTSWGTMGILIPLVVPLAVHMVPEAGPMLHASIAAVLAGAVFGDHCSPISDTTILSSMASGCNHVEHVRTQLPYALLAGSVALLIGVLPAGLGVPFWVSLPLGALVLVGLLRTLGTVPAATKTEPTGDSAAGEYV